MQTSPTKTYFIILIFKIYFIYRKDSDVVAPYEKWEYYDHRVKQLEQDRNYALNKTRKVAWFVSNCGARNGRLQYAHELQKHIQVCTINETSSQHIKFKFKIIFLFTGRHIRFMRCIQMLPEHSRQML